MQDPLDRPTPLMPPGTVLCDRYRVLRSACAEEHVTRYGVERVGWGRELVLYQSSPQGAGGSRPPALEGFYDEGRRLAALAHPSLSRILDFFETPDGCFVVVELDAAPTLREVLGGGGEVPAEALVLRWAEQLCGVLDLLQAQVPPVGAGDLEPDEIRVLADGHLRLEGVLPRAILRAAAGPRDVRDARLGGRLSSGHLRPSGEVYALGRLVYYAVTRVLPPRLAERLDENRLHPLPPNATLQSLNPHVSVRTELAVERLLETDAARRACDLAEASRLLGLEQAADAPSSLPVSALLSPPPSPGVASASPASSPPPPVPDGAPPPDTGSVGPGDQALAAVDEPLGPSWKSHRDLLRRLRERVWNRAEKGERPLSFTLPTVSLMVVGLLSAAWVAWLLYLSPDQDRVWTREGRPRRMPLRLRVDGPIKGRPPTVVTMDGSVMVRVPESTFPRGSTNEDAVDGPRRSIHLDDFYMDRTEITIAQFRAFVAHAGYRAEGPWLRFADGDDAKPVTGVTFRDAVEYAEWCGKRLPSEDEWEKAARGGQAMAWPWGDRPGLHLAVTREERVSGPRPVGSLPAGASPYGLVDMAGNAWEWTASRFRPYPESHFTSGLYDLDLRVLRGGSWLFSLEEARTSSRKPMAPRLWGPDIGFRCVRSPDGAHPPATDEQSP